MYIYNSQINTEIFSPSESRIVANNLGYITYEGVE